MQNVELHLRTAVHACVWLYAVHVQNTHKKYKRPHSARGGEGRI